MSCRMTCPVRLATLAQTNDAGSGAAVTTYEVSSMPCGVCSVKSHLAHERGDLGGVVLRDRLEIGRVGLIDAHQRAVEDGDELEEGRAQLEHREGVELDASAHERRVVGDGEPRVRHVRDDREGDEDGLPHGDNTDHMRDQVASLPEDICIYTYAHTHMCTRTETTRIICVIRSRAP